MRRDLLLPLSLFTLALAIGLHAVWPGDARAQQAVAGGIPACTSFDVNLTGDLVEEEAELWMDEMLAGGRVNFVYVGSYIPVLCAW